MARWVETAWDVAEKTGGAALAAMGAYTLHIWYGDLRRDQPWRGAGPFMRMLRALGRRLVALGLRASATPALEVQPALLDLIGWQNLGESARIFAIQTDEATREAADRLTIAALRHAAARTMPPPARPRSFFDLPCEDLGARLADAALTTALFPVTPDDGLILCHRDWLTDSGSPPESAEPPAGPSH